MKAFDHIIHNVLAFPIESKTTLLLNLVFLSDLQTPKRALNEEKWTKVESCRSHERISDPADLLLNKAHRSLRANITLAVIFLQCPFLF